jgi:hypothetical protein
MPILAQAIDEKDPLSKWLLSVMSAHVALLLGFHSRMKVAERYKAFRHGESEFYDTYRLLLDRPEKFGKTEKSQIRKYFDEIALIRKFVRNAETDSFPHIEDVRSKMPKV